MNLQSSKLWSITPSWDHTAENQRKWLRATRIKPYLCHLLSAGRHIRVPKLPAAAAVLSHACYIKSNTGNSEQKITTVLRVITYQLALW